MKGSEFLRKLKKVAKDRGVEYRLEMHHGKGSHATVYFGDRCATIKDRKKEIGSGLYSAMLKQLGLDDL